MSIFSRLKLNTTKKGDEFEARVYKVVEDELKSERLAIIPSNAQLFAKKAYYSRDRNANIIVDLAIEVRLSGQEDYSILWVWECKNYAKKVPIDDLEEFHAKIQQIAGNNVKAIFITNAAFSESGLNYAKAKGIGIARLMPENQVQWIVMSRPWLTAEQIRADWRNRFLRALSTALTTPEFHSYNCNFYGVINDESYGNLGSFIKAIINSEETEESDTKKE